jgi:hypothetical protein
VETALARVDDMQYAWLMQADAAADMDRLTEQALALPPALRELVAHRIWESLHPEESWPLAPEQIEEIRRRSSATDAGTSLVDGDDVLRAARARWEQKMSEKNQALMEAHGTSPETTLEEGVAIGKAMLIAVGAGGALSPKEMERFLSVATAYGAAPDATDTWKRFDYANARISDHFKGSARLARHMMYDVIRICRADGDRARQRAKAKEAGRLLGVHPTLTASLGGIVEAEEALRNARAAIEAAVKARTSGAPAVAAGLSDIAEQEASLRKKRISLMDEDNGLPFPA